MSLSFFFYLHSQPLSTIFSPSTSTSKAINILLNAASLPVPSAAIVANPLKLIFSGPTSLPIPRAVAVVTLPSSAIVIDYLRPTWCHPGASCLCTFPFQLSLSPSIFLPRSKNFQSLGGLVQELAGRLPYLLIRKRDLLAFQSIFCLEIIKGFSKFAAAARLFWSSRSDHLLQLLDPCKQ